MMPRCRSGIQLVASGGAEDRMFVRWGERLRAEPRLLERYNAIKADHAEDEYEAYTDAKAEFIEAELGDSA